MSEFESTQPVTAGDSLIAVLDELIATVEGARAVPMSASVMINKSEVLDLLQTARDIVPDQIHAADSIIREAADVRSDAQRNAEDTVSNAKHEARTLVENAHAEAERLVSDHEVTNEARKKAELIVAEAESQAQKLGHGANRYSDDVLAGLQNNLEQLLGQVRAGRQEISRRDTADQDLEALAHEPVEAEASDDADHQGDVVR